MWNYSESCQPGPQMQQGSNHSGYDGYNGFPTSSNTFGSSIPLYRYPNIATRGGGERSKIKGLYNTIKGHETANYRKRSICTLYSGISKGHSLYKALRICVLSTLRAVDFHR